MKNKINFIPGLGEKPKDYAALSKYLHVVNVDWNNGKVAFGKIETLIGFSMGGFIACEYSITHPLKNLILCSLTPGAESLHMVKAERVIFLVGEKEKWVLKEINRVRKTLKCKSSVTLVPGADHAIKGNYRKALLKVVSGL